MRLTPGRRASLAGVVFLVFGGCDSGSGRGKEASSDSATAARGRDSSIRGAEPAPPDASQTPPALATADAAVGGCVEGRTDCVRCVRGSTICARRSESEFTGISYVEEPLYDADYNSGSYERTLQVGARTGPIDISAETGGWLTGFKVKTDRPSTGDLEFYPHGRWGVLELPKIVHMHRIGRQGQCLMPNALDLEPVREVQTSLRDTAGVLLIVQGASPLEPDGNVKLAVDGLPEVRMKWMDRGCASNCGEQWFGPGDERQHTVALEVTVGAGGDSAAILPGERGKVTIAGREYAFVTGGAQVPVDAQGKFCGQAVWTLYRTDVLVELNEDGTGPKAP